MRLTCRSCGATGSAEVVFGAADADAALMLAGDLPPAVARQVWAYLALFRPRQRALTWSRTHKLLAELVALMAEPTITRKHRSFPTTPALWRAALEHMAATRDALNLPMESHGYLLDVLSGLAEKAAMQSERDHEQGLRSAPRGTGSPAADPAPVAVNLPQQLLHSERQARRNLKLQAMTPEEENQFLERQRDLAR